MTAPAQRVTAAPADAGTGITGTRPTGPFQLLAYLLVVLALHRAAKQIQTRRDARARIPDGDHTKLAQYISEVVQEREAAETRLQGLKLGMPREDIAAALVDAVAWCEESPIARQALDQLIGFYDNDYGLVIGHTGLTLGTDPSYPAQDMQNAMDDAGTWYRQEAAALHVQSVIAATPLEATAQQEISNLVTEWAGPRVDSTALTPDAIGARRNRLATRIDASPLAAVDKAQVLFFVDYLTGRAGTSTGVDLLDTPPWPRPTTPAPPTSQAQIPHQQADPNQGPQPEPVPVPTPPEPAATRPRARAAKPSSGTGSDFGAGGEYNDAPTGAAGPTQPTGQAEAPQNPNAVANSQIQPPLPARPEQPPMSATPRAQERPQSAYPAPEPPAAQENTATDIIRAHETIEQLLGNYLSDIHKAHAHATEFAADLNTPITNDMLTLVDRLRTQRHQLLDLADHSPLLAEIERTQIRACLYDIDTGKTALPPLMWVDDTAKQAADREIHIARARDLRTATIRNITETLTTAGILNTPPPSDRDALPEPIRTAVQSLIEVTHNESAERSDPDERFADAEAELARNLADAGVPDHVRGQVSHFVRAELPTEQYADPAQVYSHMTYLLDDSGVLTEPAAMHVDKNRMQKLLDSLGDTIEAVATGTGNLERHRRRYGAVLADFTDNLSAAGVDETVRRDVSAAIRDHAGLAGALARQNTDRTTKWAEREVTRTDSNHGASPNSAGPAAQVSHHQHTDHVAPPRTRPFTPQQRRTQFWRNRTRSNAAAPTARR